MGRRTRRRALKKTQEKNDFGEVSELKFFLTTFEPSHSEQNMDQFKLVRQVKDCINEIYTEHINDLEQRRSKRLESKVPTEYFQPYNLVVNSTYQLRIKSYIQDLKKNDQGEEFKQALVQSTDVFIDYLRKHVKDFNGRKGLLQGIIVYEAYHTLQNSITQIGAIVEDLITRRDFDFILKQKFYNRIAADYFDLIDSVLTKEHSEYVEDLLRMRKTLENLGKLEIEPDKCCEYSSTRHSESCSEEDAAVEAYHNMPIDDLVKIITQDKRKKGRRIKKKSSLSTKENSASPYRDVDNEVEKFKQRLEMEKPFEVKARPFVSEEFLARLRLQLNGVKQSTN